MSCDCLEKLERAAVQANLRNNSSRWFEELVDIVRAAMGGNSPYAIPIAPITPNDLSNGCGLQRGGVWHLNEATYAHLRAWEKWGKETAMPYMRDREKELREALAVGGIHVDPPGTMK